MSTWAIYCGLTAGSLILGMLAAVGLAAALGAGLNRLDATRSQLDP